MIHTATADTYELPKDVFSLHVPEKNLMESNQVADAVTSYLVQLSETVIHKELKVKTQKISL